MILDIHTHTARLSNKDIDSRMSYSPSEPILVEGLYSLGLHPCRAMDMCDEGLVHLRQRLDKEQDNVWAIGETGLDKLSPITLSTQEYYLSKQIELSETLDKPLVLHCVRAYNELITLKKVHQPRQKWIIHGYRKGGELAKQLLDWDFYLSFGPYFDVEALRLAHQHKKMFMETDATSITIEEVFQRIQLALQ